MTKAYFSAPRIALAGGYTAGHVMPMLAVAEAWQARFPDSAPIFLGQSDGLEADLLLARDLPFFGVAGRPLFGARGTLGRLTAYGATFAGLVQARRILRREAISMVIGFGAYVTAGILLAGRSLGLATAIFEANLLPGFANRQLARHVDLRFVNLDEARQHPGWSDAIVTGMPLRQAIGFAAEQQDSSRLARRLLVTGGSLGSLHLNRRVPALAARLCRMGIAVEVLHQAGPGEEAGVAAAYREVGVTARVDGFLDDMPAAWHWADAAICAAGAGTLAEAAAVGLPVLVVPIGSVADDHQSLNARAFAASTGQPWIQEKDWDETREATLLAAMLSAERRTREPKQNNAATQIVDACARHLGLS